MGERIVWRDWPQDSAVLKHIHRGTCRHTTICLRNLSVEERTLSSLDFVSSTHNARRLAHGVSGIREDKRARLNKCMRRSKERNTTARFLFFPPPSAKCPCMRMQQACV